MNKRRLLKSFWYFHLKLIFPCSGMAILLAIIYYGTIPVNKLLGISFIFLPSFFHYIIYELSNPDEYYFYYNLGWSKAALWLGTVCLSLLTGLTLITL